MNTAEQLMDMQRSALATWSDLSVTTMTGAERWFTLQIDLMRSLFDGGLDQTRQMGDLDNPQNLITAMSSMNKPLMDTVMSYQNESFQILQSTGLELSTILNQHWKGSATKIQSMADESAVQSTTNASPPFPLNTALQSIFGSAFKSPFVPDFTGPFGRVFGGLLTEKGTKASENAKTHYPSQKRNPNNGVNPASPGQDSHSRATASSRRAHPDSN